MAYETDVLIIGAGPTGSTTALALANSGVRCHIVSRGNWMADSPRAHITNQRANEVFRDLGISEDVARYASPWELMGDTTFTTSLAGPELIRMRTWGTGDDRRGDYLRASPCGMVDIIQPLLEPILFQKAAEKGATFAFNTEYVRHEQDSDGVTATLRDRLDGREFTIRARYMVGADGARSSVVDHLDLPIEGRMARAGTVYTVFNADLSRYSKHRPSILNWIVTPDASFGEIGMGLLRAVRPWTQWIAGWGFDINKGDPDLSESNVREKIRILIGDPAIEPDIVQDVGLVHQPGVRDAVFEGARFLRRRRRPPASAVERFGQQHLRAGRPQSRLEARLRRQGLGRPEASGKLFAGEGARRKAGRAAGQPVAARLRSAERLFPRAGRRESGGGGHRALPRSGSGGRCRPQGRAGSARPQADRVQRARRRDEPAVRILGRDPGRGAEPEKWRRDRDLYNQPTTRPGAKIPHAWLVGPDGTRMSTLDVTGKGSLHRRDRSRRHRYGRMRFAASIFRSCGSS